MPERYLKLLYRARPLAPLLVILVAVGVAQTRGLGLALLVLAGGMLLMAISLIWGSVQSLGDESALSLDEALALGAPSAEEEKKRSVLRALKDLEYERSVGKVTEDDYARLSQHYRDEAKRLLQLLETAQSPARLRAEKLLAQRFSSVGLDRDDDDEAEKEAPPAEEKESEADEDEDEAASAKPSPVEAKAEEPDDEDEDEADEDEDENEDEADEDEASASPPNSKKCDECDTWNDPDARFCKSCGEAFE